MFHLALEYEQDFMAGFPYTGIYFCNFKLVH